MLLEVAIEADAMLVAESALDAADNGWNICTVVRQTVNCFETPFVPPTMMMMMQSILVLRNVGYYMREIAMSWSVCFLWLIMSTAAIMKVQPLILRNRKRQDPIIGHRNPRMLACRWASSSTWVNVALGRNRMELATQVTTLCQSLHRMQAVHRCTLSAVHTWVSSFNYLISRNDSLF